MYSFGFMIPFVGVVSFNFIYFVFGAFLLLISVQLLQTHFLAVECVFKVFITS